MLFYCHDITFGTMIIQKPPFIAFLWGCLDGVLGSVQRLDCVVFTWTQPGTGRVGAAGPSLTVVLVETNIGFNKPIQITGSVWRVLICLIMISSVAEGIWSDLGLQSPMPCCHHLLRIRKSSTEELSKSQRSYWFLFEIFVLAVCDINALTEQQASDEMVVVHQKCKTLSTFPVSSAHKEHDWTERAWNCVGATLTAVRLFWGEDKEVCLV